MRKHNGMRPQDIAILLAIVAMRDRKWFMKDLAWLLDISQAEVSESLNRSSETKLVDSTKRTVNREALLEFLEHGIRYVYPAGQGGMVRGIPTAYSAEPLSHELVVSEPVVWAHPEGTIRGYEVTPLYGNAAEAARKDPLLHQLLALVDALRMGRARERELGGKWLRKLIGVGK